MAALERLDDAVADPARQALIVGQVPVQAVDDPRLGADRSVR
jgi:hypothetical protein